MKKINPGLLTLLAANDTTTFKMVEFYSIQTPLHGLLTYSDGDLPLTYNIGGQSTAGGNVYNPLGGMKVKRDRVRTVIGTQVDSLEITFFPETTDLILGSLFTQAVGEGVLDGSWVTVDRAFLTSWSSAGIVGTVNVFAGRVSDAVVGRTQAKITVKSPFELLNVNVPPNLYQPSCSHNLFDGGCLLSKAAFTYSGTCLGPQQKSYLLTDIEAPVGFFMLGYVTFTSGVNAGLSRGIQYHQYGALALTYPFPETPSLGDTVNVFPGCDHSQTTCDQKFGNLAHFRGFPYVPLPETAT